MKNFDQITTFESTENIFTPETFSRFTAVDEDILLEFSSRLSEVDGHCRFAVHPFYTEQNPDSLKELIAYQDIEVSSVQANLRAAFERLVISVNANQHSSPLIVYESIGNMTDTDRQMQDWIGYSDIAKRGIIKFPTEEGSAVLSHEYLMNILEVGNRTERNVAEKIKTFFVAKNEYLELTEKHIRARQERFPEIKEPEDLRSSDSLRDEYLRFIMVQREELRFYFEIRKEVLQLVESFQLAFLRHIGVRSAIVSGAYLTSYKSKEKNNLAGCAGYLVECLRDGHIQTDISRNIFPEKEKLRKDKAVLKQTGGKSEK